MNREAVRRWTHAACATALSAAAWGAGWAPALAFAARTPVTHAQDATAPAQTTVPTPAPPVLEPPSETEILAAIDASASLPDILREQVSADLTAALEALAAASVARVEAEEFARVAADAPEQIETLRNQLSQPPEQPMPTPPEGATAQQIADLTQQARAEAAQAKSDADLLSAEPARRQERLAAIPTQVPQLAQQAAELEARLASPPTETLPPERAAARLLRERAELALLRAQLARAEAERASYIARDPLLPLRRDVVQRRAESLARLVQSWETLEAEQRREEARLAEREAERLRREAAARVPELKQLADDTARFAGDRTGPSGVVELIRAARERLTLAQAELDRLRARARATERKVSAAELSAALGAVLRSELDRLPDETALASERRRWSEEAGTARFRQVVVEEALADISDVAAAMQRIIEDVDLTGSGAEPADAERVARELLTNQRDTLRELSDEYNTLIERLVELDTVLADTIGLTRRYRGYIEERVLWIRSVTGSLVPSAQPLADAARWLVDPAAWTDGLRRLWTDRAESRSRDAPLLLLVFLVWLARPAARRGLHERAALVAKYTTDRYTHTLWAVAMTALLAAARPGTLAAAGWLLRNAATPQLSSVGEAALAVSAFWFVLEFVRQAARPKGLAESHFRWPTEGLAALRADIRLYAWLALPAVGVSRTLSARAQDNTLWDDSLGRAAMIVGFLVTAWIYWRIFSPARPLVRTHLARHPGTMLARTRRLWWVLLGALPTSLALATALGYSYTARKLDERLHGSIWLGVGLLVVHGLVLRWLFMERRRLAIQRAKSRREAAKDAEQRGEGLSATEAGEELRLEIPEIDTQTRRLNRAVIAVAAALGLLAIWSDVLPALRLFDRVQLWPSVRFVDSPRASPIEATLPTTPTTPAPAPNAVEAAPAESGSATLTIPGVLPMGTAAGGEAQTDLADAGTRPITIADAGLSALIVALVWVLTRNVPGLLEITILKRLPLDAGARFAFTTVVRYVIAIVGILIAFSVLGLRWNQLQWLVAALTFGLAFGLQEIFANFISGLIILVERPIRVGDTVTVGDVNGTVTRIQMRATTIQDWDLKELIVPNKTFITDRVINWTLSDPRIRLVCPVGVAYGTDPRRVTTALLDIARIRPEVLSEPAPRVIFTRFGDSTLDFELRVFLKHFDSFLTVRHELNSAIAERFTADGIEIAFPQRDLHIRSVGPLAAVLDQRSGSREAEPE